LIELPSTDPLKAWVGREYSDGQCWNVVRDAFREVGGVHLPRGYYDAAHRFTQVDGPPQGWDVVMLRTNPRAPILVLHSGLAIDSERFIHAWGALGVVMARLDDSRWSDRIAGFLRICR
jgi:cell wall-associated NlpC family hydrolase